MKKCLNCNKKINNPKFCSQSCSATYNNKLKTKKQLPKCRRCSNLVKDRHSLFCSQVCSTLFRREERLSNWLLTGKVNKSGITSRDSIREFILEDQNNKCALCPQTTIWYGKKLVFILDHIDGNSNDSSRTNVRMVCPNCNSQLDTFTSKNKNGGRHWRRQRYAEGKSA